MLVQKSSSACVRGSLSSSCVCTAKYGNLTIVLASFASDVFIVDTADVAGDDFDIEYIICRRACPQQPDQSVSCSASGCTFSYSILANNLRTVDLLAACYATAYCGVPS